MEQNSVQGTAADRAFQAHPYQAEHLKSEGLGTLFCRGLSPELQAFRLLTVKLQTSKTVP